jgi:hypothetical protein
MKDLKFKLFAAYNLSLAYAAHNTPNTPRGIITALLSAIIIGTVVLVIAEELH